MHSEQEIARIYAESFYLKVVICFRLLTSSIAIVCMIILELNRKKFVAHKSLQILLTFHGFWTFLLCISSFVESIRQAYAHLTLIDPSDLLLTSDECFVRMFPQFFGICGSVTSLLAMSVERFEASRNLATYEYSKRKQGMKFVAFHITLVAITVIMDACMYDFPTRVPHCTAMSVTGRPIQTVDAVLITIFELISISIYTKSLKHNLAVQRSEQSMSMTLTEKYQLAENVRVLQLLLPVVLSHFAITMIAAAGFFYFELAGLSKEYYPMLEESINIVYLQGIAMPLIFLNRYRNKRLIEAQIVTTNMASGDELIAAHDQAIKRGW